jgi:hypothetical protein
MSFTMTLYFCLQCNNSAKIPEAITHKECHEPFMVVKASVNFEMKRTRWDRFLSWLYARDISLGIAVIGLMVMNGVVLIHFNFNFTQSVIEGLGFGLAIPRLLK